MNRRARLRHTLLALTLAATLAGCGGEDAASGSDEPSSSPDDSASPTTSGVLDFETVEALTAPRFQSDKNCAIGIWGENSTGVPEEYAATVAMFRQFDCYRNEGQVGGFPERGQQSIFVEFEDAVTAESYAQDALGAYWVLFEGNHVVVAGSGLKSVDMEAYISEIQQACGCGEVIAAEY